MTHFRQERVINHHFVQTEGEAFTHVFKGQEYEITPENYQSLNPELLQSISTRLSKQYGSSLAQAPKPGKGGGKEGSGQGDGENEYQFDEEGPNKAPGTDYKKNNGVTSDILIVRKELIRLSLSEKIFEEKLNYPKVFERLLSQPHLALEEKRKTVEEYHELYVFVDTSSGYMRGHHELHNAIIEEGSKIKGIKVYYGPMVRHLTDGSGKKTSTKDSYYWSALKHLVPKGKRVIVFTQGCGGVGGGNFPMGMGYKVNFCTPFKHGSTCGCNTIPKHYELSQKNKLVKMNYGIFKAEDLKKIELF